jgi:seryl-tRNA synthetase
LQSARDGAVSTFIMIDIKRIRENADAVRAGIEQKREPGAAEKLGRILELDTNRREIIGRAEALKAKRNAASEEIGKLKKGGLSADVLMEEMRGVADEVKALDDQLRSLDADLEEALLWLPNIPHESVPLGLSSAENVTVKHGTPIVTFDFPVRDHLDLGKRLGIFDFERGAKISGSGFPVYFGKGAALERALVSFFLSMHTANHGYTEVFPPFVVNEASLRGTAQLPKSREDMYKCENDDLYLIPTAEVPVTNLHRDETLRMEQLPVKYCAYSACFRREAGSYGKDTKGFLRLHQFNKVELVKFTTPESSFDELESLTANAEAILDALEIPYRRILLCTGDTSFSSAKTYDLEAWSPAEQKWLEVSSCSNFLDFQARRANIKFKRDAKSKPEFVHTLNGSGLATSRVMVALIENHQTPDGTIVLPKALHPFTGFTTIS